MFKKSFFLYCLIEKKALPFYAVWSHFTYHIDHQFSIRFVSLSFVLVVLDYNEWDRLIFDSWMHCTRNRNLPWNTARKALQFIHHYLFHSCTFFSKWTKFWQIRFWALQKWITQNFLLRENNRKKLHCEDYKAFHAASSGVFNLFLMKDFRDKTIEKQNIDFLCLKKSYLFHMFKV